MIKQDNNVWEQGSSQPVDNDPVQPVRLRTNSFDIDFRRVISIWPYILLFGLLGYLVGSIYLRYLNFVYILFHKTFQVLFSVKMYVKVTFTTNGGRIKMESNIAKWLND